MDRRRTVDIAQGIKEAKLNIKWHCSTRVDLMDEELLRIMYHSGCRSIFYGVESGNERILNIAQKESTVEQAENTIRWTKRASIKAYCSFIFCLPGKTWETIRETLGFVSSTFTTGAQFNMVAPYPGTKLCEMAYCKAHSPAEWQGACHDQAAMGTGDLSAEYLNQARLLAYRSLYSNPQWWGQTIWHIIRHTDEFELAARYMLRIVGDHLFHLIGHVQ
ncbi:B12-binding domain-containing radical SAM protein [Chloroflexota bacterium]